MKISRPLNHIAGAMVLFAVAWFGWTLITLNSEAQSTCCVPTVSGGARWVNFAQVTVTIDPQFTQVERAKIIEAFQDWNVQGVYNCSNVYFSGFTLSSTPPSTFIDNVYWVTYRNIYSDVEVGHTNTAEPHIQSNYKVI